MTITNAEYLRRAKIVRDSDPEPKTPCPWWCDQQDGLDHDGRMSVTHQGATTMVVLDPDDPRGRYAEVTVWPAWDVEGLFVISPVIYGERMTADQGRQIAAGFLRAADLVEKLNQTGCSDGDLA